MSIPRFWRNIKSRYNLIGKQCKSCKSIYFPPRNFCPKCRRIGELEDYKLKGNGEVVTYTIIRTPPDGFDMVSPYIMGIVELEEGPMLTTQIVDADVNEIYIGMPVKRVFRKIGEDGDAGLIYYGFKFRPASKEE
ncbi:MAG TPA: Zn-ribbon domain-containing OB-fold protein [Euryarchaeota archaeon]|nr:hypothetical protein BMS3Bbin15_00315 [archaeon BMS3Bbin15]HDL14828.1 Zn-ribbon domain-containing OB-fold protein [Euryarchaeota archaeon]